MSTQNGTRPAAAGAMTSPPAGQFIENERGAVTSDFVVLTAAAVAVTAAVLLSVGGGADAKTDETAEQMASIEPGELLVLDTPPNHVPGDEEAGPEGEPPASGGTPEEIATAPQAPEASDPAETEPVAAAEAGGSAGGSGAGSGAASGSSNVSGGGGFSGFPGGSADEDEDEEPAATDRSRQARP
ncbi:MAG: hypothetical protein QNJ13_10365 [Paracoccaceae bacterium]|nr:hypothetical protein [Paracoccaceae bacterium]